MATTPLDAERLYKIFTAPDFLSMKGQANEVPIFVQPYDPTEEDAIRQTVSSLTDRLRNSGLIVKSADFFNLVLAELEHHGILADLIRDEPTFERIEILETLQNFSDPKHHLVPRLIQEIASADPHFEPTQLTLITGAGRIFPFLRTHTILENLQPAMLRHPVVIFFPGEYHQDPGGGSHFQLFGSIPSPKINNPYYRATNLDHYRLFAQ